ncbi:unnamed protein product [Closterium sp. NIES-54]
MHRRANKLRMSIEGTGGEVEGGSGLGEEISSRSSSTRPGASTDPVSRAATSDGGSSTSQSVPLPSATSSPASPHPFAQSLSASLTLLLRSLPLALPHLLSTTLPGLQSSLHLLPPFGPSASHKSRSPFTTNAFRGGSYGGGNSGFPSNLFSGPPSTGPIWPWAPGGSRAHRKVTDLLLAVNAAAFLLQILSNNRLLLLGAKVNSLIRQGQYYRLLSSALLHADLQHLVVNSLSLNTIGPDAESLLGGRRMAGIYAASALASSALSLVLNPSPSVGASGAIFGLVGALGVFFLRHKKQLSLRGSAYLRGLGTTVMFNMVLGVFWRNIDNSGHLGGLLGGAAVAWLVGPRIISAGFPPKLYDYPPIAELLRARRLLESQVQADESLCAHASGDLPKPDDPAPLGADPSCEDRDRYAHLRADLTAWNSRDAAACIALNSLLPESEEAHFTQARTASEFLTAIKARYATPTTVSLGRLFLPFPFPDLASFERSADLIAHMCSLDSNYRAACTNAQLALLPPPMAITIYFIATSFPDRLASVRDTLLLKHPSELTIEFLECALKDVKSSLQSVASASGAVPPPLFHGCIVPQLPIFTASLATPTNDVTVAAVMNSSRSRGRSGRRGSQGAGGGGGGDGGGVASGGDGSTEVGGATRAAAGDSPIAAGGGDAQVRQAPAGPPAAGAGVAAWYLTQRQQQ